MSKKKKELRKLETKILSLFKSAPESVFNYKQIAAKLNVRDTKDRNNIIRVLHILESKGITATEKRGKYKYKKNRSEEKPAVLKILPTGKGIVYLESLGEELIVPNRYLNKAFDGDHVQVSLHRTNKTLVAHVETILKREKREYVGVLERQDGFGFVSCRSSHIYTDFFIEKEELKDYKDGEKVVVVLKEWGEKMKTPNGTIIKSLGVPGETETEIHSILHEYGLPYEFHESVEKEASMIPTQISEEEIKKRKDFRSTLTFTIDPKTAKDFDDALSFKELENGKIEVGIHIADVSHYVTSDSLMDREAYDRATSVYLVDRVVPMLPEALSNGLCSLRPQEEKLTFSAVFQLDEKGNVTEEWYGKTVIFSDFRFAYEEVQYMIENNQPFVNETKSLTNKAYTVPEGVFNAILILNKQAKRLRKERMKNGAIAFDREEVNFNLDEENMPTSVFFKHSQEAHKLIEEFMLLANRKVASLIGKQQKKQPFIYRTHDAPDDTKLENLKKVVSHFGYSFNPTGKKRNQQINTLLSSCQGKKEQNLIDTLTLRCMSKAEYSTQNIGHYGLAFSHYTHFTSPIRRYPDVLVHRLLQLYLDQKTLPSEATLEEACQHSSKREQLATKAERESIRHMQMVFMKDKIGHDFEGVISGVTERGLFVEIVENKCEGMIRSQDIKGDFFYFDTDHHALVGERTKKIYQLGDTIKIRVKKVNVIKRFLDFVII